MNKIRLYFIALLMGGLALLPLASCSEDDLGESIFPDSEQTLDPNSLTYQFDKWLEDNYRKPYNIQFLYKMQDISTNMYYNLVPADYTKAQDLALLLKYLWFDAYAKVAGEDFLKENAPRMIHIIGSPSMNPNSGYETFGLSEGGVKVSLFKVNNMNINDFKTMNIYYFATMHRVYAHILHQKITYPKEFNEITNTSYDLINWNSLDSCVVNSKGFVTKFACSETREDFAEVIAQYITMSDEDWAKTLDRASKGWHEYALQTGSVYCSHFFFNNNKSGDDNKAYVTDKLGYSVKSNEKGDTLTLLRYGEEQFQYGVDPITSEDIYDKNGNLVRTSYTDANGNQVKEGSDGNMYVIDGEGNFTPIWVYEVDDEDDVDGKTAIEQKLSIASRWLKNQWHVDLEELRREVQKRQNEFQADPAGVLNRLRQEANF